MTFDDETLGAYVDGELDPAVAAGLEQAAATDAALADRIDRARRLRALMGGAFPSVMAEPASERFLKVVAGGAAPSAEIIRFQGKPKVKARPEAAIAKPVIARTWSGPGWGALAACLAAGILIGVIAPWKSNHDTALSPGREVTLALNNQDSGPKAGAVRIGLSFKARDGAYCRTFLTTGTAGLACRQHGAWSVRAAAPTPTGADTAYRTASSEMPVAVLDAVDAMIDGAPLDAKAEATARARGWK